MDCTVCGQALGETTPTCPSCGQDARLTLVNADGARHGPYTVAELRQYAAQGLVQTAARLETAYGTVLQPTQLGLGPPAPAQPTPQQRRSPSASERGRALKADSPGLVTVGNLIGCVLILIAVPSIIAGVMFLGSAKHKAPQIKCKTNLQAIGVAISSYAQANGGKLPDGATWDQALQSYLKDPSVIKCPASGYPYSYNQNLSNAAMSQLTDPSVALVYDQSYGWQVDPPHYGGWNVLYCNGDVEWVAREKSGGK